jgi:hypothetical protein
MSTTAVLEAVVMLAEIYSKELSEGATRLYVATLGDLTQDEVGRMTRTCLASDERFLPPPGILLRMAGAAPCNQDEDAAQAWVALDKALDAKNTGPLPERIKHVVAQMGGGSYLMGLTRADFNWRRKEFVTLYQAAGQGQAAIEAHQGQDRRSLAEQVGADLQLKSGAGG